jgi:hypothetical protein
VLRSSDHSYRQAVFDSTTAVRKVNGWLSEDFGDDSNELEGRRVPVLVVSYGLTLL